jgi:hypothetical protein
MLNAVRNQERGFQPYALLTQDHEVLNNALFGITAGFALRSPDVPMTGSPDLQIQFLCLLRSSAFQRCSGPT